MEYCVVGVFDWSECLKHAWNVSSIWGEVILFDFFNVKLEVAIDSMIRKYIIWT